MSKVTVLLLCGALAMCVACGSGNPSNANNNSGPGGGGAAAPAGPGSNVLAISVNAGPLGNYANGVFASVTLCVPGTSNCQTIDSMLVDTGSSGIRVLSSALSLTLPTENASSGKPMAECAQFVDSFSWGPVQIADVNLSSEHASSVPIQVIGESQFPVAAGCKATGLKANDTLQTLGANGILGVGLFLQDCGPACAQTSGNPNFYYSCPTAATCAATQAAANLQLQNPVALFSGDNNGVIVELPAISGGGSPPVAGSLVFGIGTQSNNGLSGTVYTLNAQGGLTTTFNGKSYPGSFIDSGSNALFFLDAATSGIPVCKDNSSFYCPASTMNLSAMNQGGNGASTTVNFSVANADSILSAAGAAAFNDLAGPSPGNFDWGLPFFFGRTVFTAIEGRSTPQGTGPYWAY